MPLSAKAARTACDAIGEGGIGTPNGITNDTCEAPARPRACRNSCIRSAVSLGAGGHLNGVEVTPTTTCPPANSVQHIAQRERPGDGVELIAALGKPRSGGWIKICSEGNHQDVGLERLGVGDHSPGHRVQGLDCRADEADTGPDHVGIPVEHVIGGGAAKHHVELREAEHEPVRLVDQHHLSAVAEAFRQQAREFQAAEASPENHYPHLRSLRKACRADRTPQETGIR